MGRCGFLSASFLLLAVLLPGVAVYGQNSLSLGSALSDDLGARTIDVTLDNADPVEGFFLSVGFDTMKLSTMNVGVLGTATDAMGAELVVPEIFEAAGGWTLGVVLDNAAPFNGQTIAPGSHVVAKFDMIPDVVVAAPEDVPLTFVDGAFNNPPVENSILINGVAVGVGGGLILNDGMMSLGPPPPPDLDIEDLDLMAEMGAQAASSVRGGHSFGLGPGPGTTGVQGYVLVTEYEEAFQEILLVDINIAGTDAEAVGAEFVVPQIYQTPLPGGSLAVVLDINPPFDGQFIPAGVDINYGNFVYESLVTIEEPSSPPFGTFPVLQFANGILGVPPLDNVLVVNGQSIGENEGLILGDGGFLNLIPIPPPPLEDTQFYCGVLDDEGNIVDPQVQLGHTTQLCFFYTDPTDNLQGFQLAVEFDCNLCFIEGTFTIEGTILEAVGAEFVSHSVDNDPDDGDGCEFVAGILLDALPPFERQTVPMTDTPLAIGCIDVQVKEDAPCNTCLPVNFADDFINGGGNIPIENIVVRDNESVQNFITNPCNICTIGVREFIRGDCNDDVKVDIADAATVLEQQFQGLPVPCLDACDANDDGKINLADAVYILNYLFDGGDPPPPPTPSPIPTSDDQGPDPTDDDELDCENGRDSCQ